MSKVYVFDIFDILVTRKIGLSQHIYIQTGIHIKDEIGICDEPKLFANARIEVERKLKKEYGYTPGLYFIYKNLRDRLEISDRTAEKILKTELKTELENALSVDKNVTLLNKLRNNGKRIIYMSDTCLGSEIVKEILKKLGIYRDEELIYCSCDYKIGSAEKLYSFVKTDTGLQENELYYVGNNRHLKNSNDSTEPLPDSHFHTTELNRYEEYLTENVHTYKLSSHTTLKYSKMAGASRYARLQTENDNRIIYDVAVSVAAPFLVNFVSNVLENASGKKIYFIARDGYIMHRIAEKIRDNNNLDVELNYLYLSREVLVLANLNRMSYNEFIEYLKKIYAYEKLSYVLRLFSIDQNELTDLNLGNSDLNQKISSFGSEFFDRIFNDSAVKQKVHQEIHDRKKKLIAYLDQEGLFTGQPVTIVDSGWYLTIHNFLAEYLNHTGQKPPEGFYFGINELAESSLRNGKKYGYFWDLRKGEAARKYKGMAFLMEIFCSAPHGRTLDYRLTGSRVQPVLDIHEIDYLSEWGIHDLTNGILTCVESVLDDDVSVSPNKIDPEILSGLLRKFWLKPTRDEIHAWGKYPFVFKRGGGDAMPLHENKTFIKILMHIITKGKLPNEDHDHWPYAHIYSLDKFRSTSLQYALRLKRKLHYLKRSYTP